MLMLILSTISRSGAGSVAAAEELTAEERKQLFGLVDQFRGARDDTEARAKIVTQVLKFDEAGASIIKKLLDRELEPLILAYTKALDSAARSIYAKQLKTINLEKVEQLREAFFTISQKPDLSKDDLKRAEPIFRSLEQMVIVVNPEELFGNSPALRDRRDRLQELAGLLRRCVEKAAEENTLPDDLDPWLRDLEQHAIGNARPMRPVDRQVIQINSKFAASLDVEEVRVVNDLNYMRMILGLSALVIDPKLAACARDHCKDMEKLKFFSHTSPVSGKATPRDRAKAFAVETRSENIYMGTTQGQKAHWGWFFSPGHHVNMLSPDRKAIGVGRSGKYFTQMFQ